MELIWRQTRGQDFARQSSVQSSVVGPLVFRVSAPAGDVRHLTLDDRQLLVGEVLAFKPETQFALCAWCGLEEPDACIAPLVLPRHFGKKFHGELGAWQNKVHFHRTKRVMGTLQANADAALTEIHEMGPLAIFTRIGKRYGHIQSLAMVAESLIQNQVSRRR